MASKTILAANNNNADFVPSGIVDSAGNPYFKIPPAQAGLQSPSGGQMPPTGGDHGVSIAELKKNVGFLNWALGIIFIAGLGAIISSYLLLAGRIDDRYDKIGGKIDSVASQISDMRVSITKVQDRDEKPKDSQRAK